MKNNFSPNVELGSILNWSYKHLWVVLSLMIATATSIYKPYNYMHTRPIFAEFYRHTKILCYTIILKRMCAFMV